MIRRLFSVVQGGRLLFERCLAGTGMGYLRLGLRDRLRGMVLALRRSTAGLVESKPLPPHVHAQVARRQ
jgi:hypothetical protein